MALKITTQIGTNKGITSEAYIRISEYQISKFGYANFKIEIYQSKEDISNFSRVSFTNNAQAKNEQIGDNLYVNLLSNISETTSITNIGTGGEEIITEETVVRQIPDLSSAQEIDIFTFGYTHLKAKLVDLFGVQNVVDC